MGYDDGQGTSQFGPGTKTLSGRQVVPTVAVTQQHKLGTLADKILEAGEHAKAAVALNGLKFVATEDGDNIVIILNNIAHFDDKDQAEKIAEQLNKALAPALSDISRKADVKIREILGRRSTTSPAL